MRERSVANCLPARSEMVTTLLAQMSDLRAPISKSTTRAVDLYQWVCARDLVGVKGAETKAKRS
jgi:hypothetical protein